MLPWLALTQLLLAGTLLVGCAPSLAPRAEDGTMPIGVAHEDEFYASRPTYTSYSFGHPPPHLRFVVGETELKEFGSFALDYDWEEGPRGTVTMKGVVYDIIDATEIAKEGKASTIMFTVAQQNSTARVIPAELVIVAWPDRGRTYRLYGKPLIHAIRQDRVGDLATLKARFKASLERRVAGVAMTETATGFDASLGPRKTPINLQNLLQVTNTGAAGVVVGHVAESTMYRLQRPVEEGATVNNQADAIVPMLAPEALFSTLPQGERDKLVSDPVGPGTVAVYVIDYPDHFDLLEPKKLSELQLARNALAAKAGRNLLENSGKIYRVHLGKGVYLISSTAPWDASLIQVPEIWEELDSVLVGERIVAVPDRDTLLVTGTNNTQGLELIRNFLRNMDRPDNPVARHLLVWQGGKWEHSPL